MPKIVCSNEKNDHEGVQVMNLSVPNSPQQVLGSIGRDAIVRSVVLGVILVKCVVSVLVPFVGYGITKK